MKKVFTSIRVSLKNASELFKVQLSFGWKGVFTQFIYILLLAIKSLIPVLLPKIVIDVCQNGTFSIFVAILTGISILSWILDATIGITEIVQSIYNLKFAHYFKRQICMKAMSLDYRDIEDQACLDALNQAMDAAYYGLSDTLFSSLLVNVARLMFLFVTVSTLHIGVALITLCAVIIIYFINHKSAAKNHLYEMEKSPFRRQSEYVENTMLDPVQTKDIRVFGAKDLFIHKFLDASNAVIGVTKQQNLYNLSLRMIKTLITGLLMGGMYIYLIICYSAGLVAISSFTMYIAALSALYDAVNGVFESLLGFRENNIKLAEVKKTLEHRETILAESGENLEGIQSIEFKNVTFTYPGQSTPAIRNLSFKAENYNSVILVGENGAGKTTIIKLLLRLYDVDEGAILVNGKDIRQYSYKSYISHFAPVFQDVWLFAYSIKENLTFGKKEDNERMHRALLFAGIAERIASLPDGTETFCGKSFDDNGINFSGGEQQKLTIARAIYKTANVVIMDEPNSALDPLSEKTLSENLRELAKSKLLFLISHKLSMSRFCNHILVLEHGEILEEGTHKELLEKNGRYAELYLTQAKQYQ